MTSRIIRFFKQLGDLVGSHDEAVMTTFYKKCVSYIFFCKLFLTDNISTTTKKQTKTKTKNLNNPIGISRIIEGIVHIFNCTITIFLKSCLLQPDFFYDNKKNFGTTQSETLRGKKLLINYYIILDF